MNFTEEECNQAWVRAYRVYYNAPQFNGHGFELRWLKTHWELNHRKYTDWRDIINTHYTENFSKILISELEEIENRKKYPEQFCQYLKD